jgi:hypothetical protein
MHMAKDRRDVSVTKWMPMPRTFLFERSNGAPASYDAFVAPSAISLQIHKAGLIVHNCVETRLGDGRHTIIS